MRLTVHLRRPRLDLRRPRLDLRRPRLDLRRPRLDLRRPRLDLRRLRLVLAVLLCLLCSAAEARKVRVRGGAQLLAQATFLQEGEVLELSGQLIDDGREPVVGAWVEVRGTGGLDVSSARGCPAPRVTVAPLTGGLRVQTAQRGEICLRWRETPGRGTIALAFGGDAYHGSAALNVEFDRDKPQRLATSLRFEPRPSVVDLDKDRIVVSGVLDLALATAHAQRDGLAVTLVDERNQVLAKGNTGGDGKVRLSVAPSELPGPGAGKLELRFAGNEQLAPASDEQPITRRATVIMRLAEEVDAADPGDTTVIHLELVSSHGRAPVDGGVVEALLGGSSAGSASVKEGKVELTVLIDAGVVEDEEATEVELSLRYLPSSPFFMPGPAFGVEVPIAPPSILLRVLLTVVVLAAGVWVVVSWRRSKKLPRLIGARPLLTPGVHVVHSKRGAKSWNGTVVDAHEGNPLRDVRIFVRAPTLEGDGVLLETTTDQRGAFAFDLADRPDGAELVTHSVTHSEERKALPAGGTLRIALITRRRALIRRFVSWARVRGRPYDDKPEATPGHVRAVAATDKRTDVESWASAVENAAFGPGEVDEATERQVRDVEPGP